MRTALPCNPTQTFTGVSNSDVLLRPTNVVCPDIHHLVAKNPGNKVAKTLRQHFSDRAGWLFTCACERTQRAMTLLHLWCHTTFFGDNPQPAADLTLLMNYSPSIFQLSYFFLGWADILNILSCLEIEKDSQWTHWPLESLIFAHSVGGLIQYNFMCWKN